MAAHMLNTNSNVGIDANMPGLKKGVIKSTMKINVLLVVNFFS